MVRNSKCLSKGNAGAMLPGFEAESVSSYLQCSDKLITSLRVSLYSTGLSWRLYEFTFRDYEV